MSDWASKWDLRINHDKSLVMHIGKGNVAEYSMNGVALKICKSVRDLGIFVDCNLNFTEHIDHIVRKAYSSLFRLFRIAHTSNPTILTRLYNSFVLPHLEYGSQIWSPSKKKYIAKLEKVQETFTRMLCRRMSTDLAVNSYKDRLKKLGMSSLRNRRIHADLILCFRILRNETKLTPSKYWCFRPTSERTGGFNLHYPKIQHRKFDLMFNNSSIEQLDGWSSYRGILLKPNIVGYSRRI